MHKYSKIILIISLLLSLASCKQVTVHLEKIPANTPGGSNIYVAGNFNFWDPGDERYIMDFNKKSGYSITLPVSFGNIEYKFTRGDWSTVESDRCGNEIENRVIKNFDQLVLENKIESWTDLEPLECDSVTIVLTKLPKNTPKDAEIKIAGNFNAWNPATNKQYIFSKDKKTGNYALTLKKKPGIPIKDFRFKIVRSTIVQSESDRYGNEIDSRKIDIVKGDINSIEVENWIDLAEPGLNSVTIILTKIPNTTPANSQVFLAGNFNDWNSADRKYVFRKKDNGNYYLSIPRLKYGLSFKVTRGSWDSEAADKRGFNFSNYDCNYNEVDTIKMEIPNWKDIKPEISPYITFIIDKLPENTPTDENIYMVFTFNNWATYETTHSFDKLDNGTYRLDVKKKSQGMEYKITRGRWQNQELLTTGNRLASQWDNTIHIKIAGWSDLIKDKSEIIRIELAGLPENTPPNATIYIAGGFNGWNPGDRDFILKRDSKGTYYIELPRLWLKQGFKFTRGNWRTVEGDRYRTFIENRIYEGKDQVLRIRILSWEG